MQFPDFRSFTRHCLKQPEASGKLALEGHAMAGGRGCSSYFRIMKGCSCISSTSIIDLC